jgi:hypothetical protein
MGILLTTLLIVLLLGVIPLSLVLFMFQGE